jgi:hypothetical protein
MTDKKLPSAGQRRGDLLIASTLGGLYAPSRARTQRKYTRDDHPRRALLSQDAVRRTTAIGNGCFAETAAEDGR